MLRGPFAVCIYHTFQCVIIEISQKPSCACAGEYKQTIDHCPAESRVSTEEISGNTVDCCLPLTEADQIGLSPLLSVLPTVFAN